MNTQTKQPGTYLKAEATRNEARKLNQTALEIEKTLEFKVRVA